MGVQKGQEYHLKSLEKVKSHNSKVGTVVQTHQEKLTLEHEQLRIDLETRMHRAEQKREEILEKKIENAQKCGHLRSASADIHAAEAPKESEGTQ